MPEQTCSDCLPEAKAKELAIKSGLTEYLVFDGTRHWVKRFDGSFQCRATYEIQYWHGLTGAGRARYLLERWDNLDPVRS